MKVAVGVLAALLVLSLIAVTVLVWLFLKARSASSTEEPKDSPCPAPRGLRPSTSDFMIAEAKEINGSPSGSTKNKNAVYVPLSKSIRTNSSQNFVA